MSDVPPPPPPTPPSGSFGTPPPASGPDIGAAISYGWKKFTENVGPVLAVLILPAAISIIAGILAGALLQSSIFLYILVEIIGFVASAAAGIGVFRVALQLTAGEPADVGKAFQYDRWGEWILFSIVFGLMYAVGLALCIIPGLLVLAFFGLAPYFFIDGRMGIGDALSNAQKAASSKSLALPVFVLILVGVAGAIACGIGFLVTAPIGYIGVAYLYRYAIGQQVAA